MIFFASFDLIYVDFQIYFLFVLFWISKILITDYLNCVVPRLDNIVKEAPNIEKEEEKARTEITKINKKRVELTKEYQADIEVNVFHMVSCHSRNPSLSSVI